MNYTPNGMVRRLTGSSEETARIPVDNGQTGFFERREFRISIELNIQTGTALTIKFSAPVNFILLEQSIACDANMLKFEAVVGGTPSGTFDTVIPVWGKNRMTERPTYTGQITASSGGSVSGGQVAEVIRIKSSNATAQQTTVNGDIGTERGLPAGDYYLRLSASGGDVTGSFALAWEERP